MRVDEDAVVLLHQIINFYNKYKVDAESINAKGEKDERSGKRHGDAALLQ